MGNRKKLGRTIFLALGILIGILIFLYGSQINGNMRQAKKAEQQKAQTSNQIIMKFFS